MAVAAFVQFVVEGRGTPAPVEHTQELATLRRRYGSSYEKYCAAVPGWWQRRTPYRGGVEQT